MKNDLENLIKICKANLKNSKESISYLKDARGLSQETIDFFEFGFFPTNLKGLYNYVDKEFLIEKAICYEYGSKFANYYNLVFPIYSEYNKSELIAIAGRTLMNDQQRKIIGIPKYENSSYKKSKNLYNLNNARSYILQKQDVIVCEGYFDVISLYSRGIKNCVAICGTSFNNNIFLKLMKYTNKITFLLDEDEAGKNAAKLINEKFSSKGAKLRFLALPDQSKDIDEYLRNNPNEKSLNNLKEFIPDWV